MSKKGATGLSISTIVILVLAVLVVVLVVLIVTGALGEFGNSIMAKIKEIFSFWNQSSKGLPQ